MSSGYRTLPLVLIGLLASALAACDELTDGADPSADPGETTPHQTGSPDPTTPPGTASEPPPSDCGNPEILPSGRMNTDTAIGRCGRYLVEGQIDLQAELVIAPGTEIRFAQEAGLNVQTNGTLRAEGTAEAPIVFRGTEETRGWWRGIDVLSDRVNNRLAFVIIRDGGERATHNSTEPAGLTVGRPAYSPSIQIQDVTFENNAGFGIFVHDRATLRNFARNTSTGNDASGAIGAPQLVSLDADSTWTGNDSDHVRVAGGTVSSAGTIPAIGVPYRAGALIFNPDGLLTVAAGATFEMRDTTFVSIHGGSFQFDGTAEAPIHFRGTEDEPGWWGGLDVRGNTESPQNRLRHVIIEHAGHAATHGSTAPAGLTIGRPAYTVSLAIEDLTLRNNTGYGVFLHERSDVTAWARILMENNSTGAASIHARAIRMLDDESMVADNTIDALRVRGGRTEHDGTWIDTGIPLRVSANVIVDSHITVEAGVVVLFEAEQGMEVQGGRLDIEGTAEAPVEMLGTQEEAGWWQGLSYRNTTGGTSSVSHLIVEDAGRSEWHGSTNPAGLTIGRPAYDADVTVTDSTFRRIGRATNNDASGLFVHSRSTANADICDVNTFEDINGTDVCVGPDA